MSEVDVELRAKIEEVEEAILYMTNAIQELEEEAQQAKNDISDAFSRQLSRLHTRQIQLLRQVDVLSKDRGEVLRNQFAYYYRVLGALKTTQKLNAALKQYGQCVLPSVSLKKFAKTPFKLEMDEDALSNAIAVFGRLEIDGLLFIPNQEMSTCLPNRVEEYQDEENHVLYKPLSGHKRAADLSPVPEEALTISVRFPKLPKDYSYWLACHEKTMDQKESVDEKSAFGTYKKNVDGKPCNVQSWLAQLMQETSDDTEFLDAFDNRGKTLSLCSDSIEVVSKADCETRVDLPDKTHTKEQSCCSHANLNCEIENLAEIFAACMGHDNQRWLSPRTTGQQDSGKKSEVRLENVCRANEICASFEDCVCTDNCQKVAMENQAEKEEQKRKFMAKLPVEEAVSYWLKTKNQDRTPSNKIVSVLPQMNTENQFWLRSKMTNKLSDKNINVAPQQGHHPYTEWLAKSARVIERSPDVVLDYKAWLKASNVDNSLRAALQELKQLRLNDKLNLKKDMALVEDLSDWLRSKQS